MKKIAVINYGMGNLHSVMKGLIKAGVPAVLTESKREVMKSAGILIPGVGAFKDAVRELKKRGLFRLIQKEAASGKPIMGICLGMQLLLSSSEEFGRTKGLGLIRGRVVKFEKKVKVPHMGWNEAVYAGNPGIMKGINKRAFYYFVHSYYAAPADKKAVLTKTRYGNNIFTSAVHSGNIYGFQFHPEKSGGAALKIYRNFYSICTGRQK
ncbi:MAG TPA: imidazole glycerol phosphate synthase subunit HisH [bacterium]|nr:imidazole glycerol phosphate synthase subunit HisH [bacterium]